VIEELKLENINSAEFETPFLEERKKEKIVRLKELL